MYSIPNKYVFVYLWGSMRLQTCTKGSEQGKTKHSSTTVLMQSFQGYQLKGSRTRSQHHFFKRNHFSVCSGLFKLIAEFSPNQLCFYKQWLQQYHNTKNVNNLIDAQVCFPLTVCFAHQMKSTSGCDCYVYLRHHQKLYLSRYVCLLILKVNHGFSQFAQLSTCKLGSSLQILIM